MKIIDILKKRSTFSFEVFPPKLDKPFEPVKKAIEELYSFSPDFISCTYGVGGVNKKRSIEICKFVESSKHNIMTHFTCIGNTKADILQTVADYTNIGVDAILAMRGDFPKGSDKTGGDFDHADKLIVFLKENFPKLTLACAGYPETHILASNEESDIAYLRSKQDAGAEFCMLQLCHDVNEYETWAQRCRKAGITMPFVMGIMPVLTKDAVVRMTLSNGCSIPKDLARIIGKYNNSPDDFKKAGKEYTVKKLHAYMNSSISGIHIYTLNKYEDIAEIVETSGIRVKK
ncbi:MAG: methylenetetrahydrofolate reductase [Spirochaetaceae bacterium]|jgi:methylenetetrahydrofolate reductase (NADPH)|nr:methylenetetrahydrofolate reductase [Spirochaetaceae bacterium]